MGIFHHRHRGDHDPPGPSHYVMREKLFSFGDDAWVENGEGDRAFKVDGKALRIRDTFVVEDPAGHELYSVKEKKLRVRDTMEIERGRDTVATVKKAMVTPLRERFVVKLSSGGDLDVKGNIVDHEYRIERSGRPVAEVSKRWFRIRDSYGIDVNPGQDPAFIVTIAACIDRMSHPDVG